MSTGVIVSGSSSLVKGFKNLNSEGGARANEDGNNKPTKNERVAEKKSKKSSSESEYGGGAEHTTNASKSKEGKHQEGRARNAKDKGGEKADANRIRTQDSKKKKD